MPDFLQNLIALNEDDASHLGLKKGSIAKIMLAEKEYLLPVTTSSGLPHGVAGIPAGMPPFEGLALPCQGIIARSELRNE